MDKISPEEAETLNCMLRVKHLQPYFYQIDSGNSSTEGVLVKFCYFAKQNKLLIFYPKCTGQKGLEFLSSV